MKKLVVVKSGGDIATGIAHRLFRSGFSVVITEAAQPTVIRRTVAFAEAVYSGVVTVEGITAKRVILSEAQECLQQGILPVLVDPQAICTTALKPCAVIDAILAKKNTGTSLQDAPLVIGVGPGFVAGKDVHAVIETMRGHDLGRVLLAGSARPNTGVPGAIGGYTTERVLRAPAAGIFTGARTIGSRVVAGELIGWVDREPAHAAIDGILRGILHDGLPVEKGMKIGDVDPRCQPENCLTISDKARAIGGGVLEALLWRGAMV
ncbi:MAG: molybdenum hydroxylase [Firmicutes bacterium]|nr:molybdenum hydroxylase [Bacillota bacterium]